MPFRLELFNCSLSRPCFATIQRALLDWSIWCNQWLYPTFQYMLMYVLHVCLYVLSITLDRLVLCTPSVLRIHLGAYAPTGIFLCVAERNKEYWFYTIVRLCMLSHMPSLLCGCWPFALTVCFMCGLKVFYIFSGVSSFSLYDFPKPFFEFELSENALDETGWWIFCKVLFAKSYFVKQLWYKLFRSDRSCETLVRLTCVSAKWHFYEIVDSLESAFA